jgi:hypothetical protein
VHIDQPNDWTVIHIDLFPANAVVDSLCDARR